MVGSIDGEGISACFPLEKAPGRQASAYRRVREQYANLDREVIQQCGVKILRDILSRLPRTLPSS